jgi:hypothetical protein
MSRTLWVWLALVLATLLSLAAGQSSFAPTLPLAIAFVKARYVGLEFMELRHAPLALRGAFEAWALATCAVLIALFVA